VTVHGGCIVEVHERDIAVLRGECVVSVGGVTGGEVGVGAALAYLNRLVGDAAQELDKSPERIHVSGAQRPGVVDDVGFYEDGLPLDPTKETSLVSWLSGLVANALLFTIPEPATINAAPPPDICRKDLLSIPIEIPLRMNHCFRSTI
jgi:hypothetical protein